MLDTGNILTVFMSCWCFLFSPALSTRFLVEGNLLKKKILLMFKFPNSDQFISSCMGITEGKWVYSQFLSLSLLETVFGVFSGSSGSAMPCSEEMLTISQCSHSVAGMCPSLGRRGDRVRDGFRRDASYWSSYFVAGDLFLFGFFSLTCGGMWHSEASWGWMCGQKEGWGMVLCLSSELCSSKM